MPISPLSKALQHLLADLRPDGDGTTDGEFLARFVRSRDENALAALVRRHAPMVWGVCCRLLHNHHDAEDAFQATFLVLVRKAADVPRQAVANWLYGVARQTAVRLQTTTAKRRRRETQVVNMPEPTVAEVRDAAWHCVLDEELSRLPHHYRGVIVLCDLEGMTRKEAARQLGIPEGSVASRLARGRVMLAKRLTRRGVVFSGGSVAAILSAVSAAPSAPPALVTSTIKAASLIAAGEAATTGVISAKVAALTEGVVRAMFLAKLNTVTCVFALTVLVGLGGVALVPGRGHLPAASASMAPQVGGDTKPNEEEAEKLVQQLGSESFADREAAQKALTKMGARAAAAVRAKIKDADPEVARRCKALWPRLWQTEMERPDAERLTWSTHPLWARFRKAAGDDPGSRFLFAEMVADFNRFRGLEAVETDPDKAGAAYTAELKQRAEALERGYRESAAAAPFRTGAIWPNSGIPTRGEFVTLLFLGTYPATAKDEGTANTQDRVFSFALRTEKIPALRRLYAAWLKTRTDPQPIAMGLNQAVNHSIAEVAPVAAAHAANDKLAPGVRGFALLAVGRFGTADDLPVLKKAFTDSRVFHTNDYTFSDGKKRPIEVQVGDAAIGSALWSYGQRAADFGFPIAALLSNHPDTLAQCSLLGFFDDDTRQAAHKKAAAWLDEHKNDKPKKYEIKSWQPLFDGKTTKSWKTEGQVTIEDGLLKIGGDKGGSIVTTAGYARGSLSFVYRQAGDAKATMTWHGQEHVFSPNRQGRTSDGCERDAEGESPIRIVAPPGTTLLLMEFAFRPY
jgi:RNA polymerase sigma factor (sigma-70 family)